MIFLASFPNKWNKHWYFLLIFFVCFPMKFLEVFFFQVFYSDINVYSGGYGKYYMSECHYRCCPECNYESKHYGVSYYFVKEICSKFWMLELLVPQIVKNLFQPKQIKVINHKRRE